MTGTYRFFRTLKRRRDDRRSGVSVTLSLFILFVSFAVIGRTLQIDLVVTSMCDPEIFRGKSPSSVTVSLVEWILIIVSLAACLQLVCAVSGVVRRSLRFLPFAIGAVNMLFAIGLLLFWGQMWAFWHPDHAAGRFISQAAWNLPIARPYSVSLGDFEMIRRVHGEGDPYWTIAETDHNGKPVYIHKASGVTNSYELVSACFPPEIYRANIRMMIAAKRLDAASYDPEMTDKRYDWILRDPKGAIILGPYFRTDPVGRELRRQEAESTPVPDWDQFADLITREQESVNIKKPISFDEFQRTYLCIKEKQRQGEYPSCRASD